MVYLGDRPEEFSRERNTMSTTHFYLLQSTSMASPSLTCQIGCSEACDPWGHVQNDHTCWFYFAIFQSRWSSVPQVSLLQSKLFFTLPSWLCFLTFPLLILPAYSTISIIKNMYNKKIMHRRLKTKCAEGKNSTALD